VDTAVAGGAKKKIFAHADAFWAKALADLAGDSETCVLGIRTPDKQTSYGSTEGIPLMAASKDNPILAVPAMPPKGQIVSSGSLYLQQISLYRNTFAFGGTRNPTDIWASMTYNMPQTMAYYRELEDKDEDVANCLDTLKLSVLERDRSVLPAPRDESAQAQEVKEFIEAQLGKLDFHAVLDCILDAPGYGFSVQEMVFDTSMGQAELASIDDCPQELFSLWQPLLSASRQAATA